MSITRRSFLQQSALFGGALAILGPFQALGARSAGAASPAQTAGYGPLLNKGPLWLPAEFNYQIISVQGATMSDGNPTPGIFDGMAAYPGRQGTTVLIRNHENREQSGEIKVLTPSALQYNTSANGDTTGPLQALKLSDEFHANMDAGRAVGVPYRVEWVTVDEPDHEDDSDNRRDRVPGFTPNRVAAGDKGAAFFDRLEGMWTGPGQAHIYFVTTAGGPANLGQVWEYTPGREILTLIYESTNSALLQSPDNVVVVPQTNDIMLCEDGAGDQFIRGVTAQGGIYDFAKTTLNDSEFCGACFDPDGQTLYVNQQGDRGSLPNGPVNGNAVTYAIYGPFEKRGAYLAKKL